MLAAVNLDTQQFLSSGNVGKDANGRLPGERA